MGRPPMAGCIGGGGFFAGPIVAWARRSRRSAGCRRCARRPAAGSARSPPPSRASGSDAAAMTARPAQRDGRRLPAERPEDVDLERADGRPVPRVRDRSPRGRGRAASPRSCCERGDPGFTIGRSCPKMGARCYPAGELFFDRLLRCPTTAGSATRARASTASCAGST